MNNYSVVDQLLKQKHWVKQNYKLKLINCAISVNIILNYSSKTDLNVSINIEKQHEKKIVQDL